MGCGCGREEGLGKKTEVARGGWAEDARRPPAPSLVSALIPLLRATWGRGEHWPAPSAWCVLSSNPVWGSLNFSGDPRWPADC